jgi:hypothetical protein
VNTINVNSVISPNEYSARKKDSILAIGSFILVIIVLAGLHLGKILTYAFPSLSLLTALYLYQRSGLHYVGFCWWIIFLSPEVRRIADFYSSWTNPSPVLLAPSLVSCVSIIAIIRYLPKIYAGTGMPFFLCFGSITYGLIVGLLSNPRQDVILACLGWIAPLLMGFYIFINYTEYPKYKDLILKVFLWGTLVMGVYGVIQYMYVPPWDAFWMDNTRNEVGFNTIGNPVPYEVRVFSTLNSPQPFATVLKAGLFVLFYQMSPLAIVASGFGYLSFFLSSARSAWVSWLFTIIVLLIISRRTTQIRLSLNLFWLTLSMVFLTALEPFSANIQGRITSLQGFQSDDSYNVRISVFNSYLDSVLTQFVGAGLGAQDQFSGDHGFLTMLNSLGWTGTLPYFIGVIALFVVLLRHATRVRDRFVGLSTAIALGTFQQMLSNLSVAGSSGTVMWTFLGLAIAGIQYEMRLFNVKGVGSELENTQL